MPGHPKDNKFAGFASYMVPHRKHLQSAMQRSGQGTNQLMTDLCYRDYRKGTHKAGKPTALDAFRQTQAQPIRRTGDDFDNENDDRVEFVNPFDNIHASWSMGVDHDCYARTGCQIIVGYPRCAKRGDKPDTGAWGAFKHNAYDIAWRAAFTRATPTRISGRACCVR